MLLGQQRMRVCTSKNTKEQAQDPWALLGQHRMGVCTSKSTREQAQEGPRAFQNCEFQVRIRDPVSKGRWDSSGEYMTPE